MSTTLVESKACHNCGALLHGPFCATCGQEDRPLDPSVADVVHEVASELSSLDGRVLRSVRRLFLSPGFLTTEYFEGRRVAWVSPVRLYLIASVAYFAIAAFADSTPLGIDVHVSGTDQETTQALEKLGYASEEAVQRAVNGALTTWTPRAMFVLVPLFGWLVSRVRRRSGRNYPQHLIFTLHVFGAFFGAQALAAALGYLTGNATIASVLTAVSLLYWAIYVVLALKAVYGGTTGRAVAHTILVLVFYWAATIVVAGAIVMPVLFWR